MWIYVVTAHWCICRSRIAMSYATFGKFPWRMDRLPIPVFLGFPGGSDGKESVCNAGDLGLVTGLERSPGGGHGHLPQDSFPENLHCQRSLAGYSSWGHKSSGMTEQLRKVHLATLWWTFWGMAQLFPKQLHCFACPSATYVEKEVATHSSALAWRPHGQRSLAGYSPWGHRESDMTEAT